MITKAGSKVANTTGRTQVSLYNKIRFLASVLELDVIMLKLEKWR